jgi:hypothetical protein
VVREGPLTDRALAYCGGRLGAKVNMRLSRRGLLERRRRKEAYIGSRRISSPTVRGEYGSSREVEPEVAGSCATSARFCGGLLPLLEAPTVDLLASTHWEFGDRKRGVRRLLDDSGEALCDAASGRAGNTA